jgi:hypothetical protein
MSCLNSRVTVNNLLKKSLLPNFIRLGAAKLLFGEYPVSKGYYRFMIRCK